MPVCVWPLALIIRAFKHDPETSPCFPVNCHQRQAPAGRGSPHRYTVCPPGCVTNPRQLPRQCSHCLPGGLDARCTQRYILSSAFNSSLHSPYPIFIDRICALRSVNDRANARNLTLSVPLRLAWVNPSDFQGKNELHGGQKRRTVISCNMEHGVRGAGKRGRVPS